MRWRDFETAAPELAALGRDRFERTNVLGTSYASAEALRAQDRARRTPASTSLDARRSVAISAP